MWFLADAEAAAPARVVSEEIAEIADKVVPAVVQLRVNKGRRRCPELLEMEAVYGRTLEIEVPENGGWKSGEVVRDSSGSGVIVDASGLVYTNQHVIEGAIEVEVVLWDHRHFPAKLIGADPRTDVAAVQIDGPGPFPYLTLGNSDRVRIGEWVMAVGNPFGFTSTVTLGVISARGRRGSEREIQDYLQTDAAINPGNSGGALVNLSGELIGINTAIFAPQADQNAGVSFSIPSNMVRRVVQEIRSGEIRRPWVGIVTADAGKLESDPTRTGAEILRVLPGSPAEQAGLRRGDVVVAAAGEPVGTSTELKALLMAKATKNEVDLQVRRDRSVVELKAVLGDAAERGRITTTLPDEVFWWAGMALVEPVGPWLAELGVDMGRGVVVADVLPGSPAGRMGISAGDRITAVGPLTITGLDALRERPSTALEVVAFDRAGVMMHAVLPGPTPVE